MNKSGKVKLSFGPVEVYNPALLKVYTDKELRAEYSRLRKVAEKRLSNLASSEFATSETYQRNVNLYPKLANIKSNAELRGRLSELSRFINAETSTVAGLKRQRSRAIKALHEQGYTFVNKANFRDFTDLMEELRVTEKGRRYGSPTPEEVETIMAARSLKIPEDELNKHFEEYMKNRQNLAEYVEDKKAKRTTRASSSKVEKTLKPKRKKNDS